MAETNILTIENYYKFEVTSFHFEAYNSNFDGTGIVRMDYHVLERLNGSLVNPEAKTLWLVLPPMYKIKYLPVIYQYAAKLNSFNAVLTVKANKGKKSRALSATYKMTHARILRFEEESYPDRQTSVFVEFERLGIFEVSFNSQH